ncbi:MAG: FtsW/RodA/SpoVE family cell cycle protein [Bacteroidales bacterium]|nr:FtsW/RodA/SpoVE family cell cycle protein [Bacteroidales bacterium]
MRHIKPIIPLLFVTIVLCFGFVTLYYNQSGFLKSVSENYKTKRAINLQKGVSATDLGDFLVEQDYISDRRDADFIAKQLVAKIDSGYALPNLGAVNTTRYKVRTTLADSLGGGLLRGRCKASRETLGLDNTVEALYAHPEILKTDSFPKSNGDKELKVNVVRKDTTKTFFNKIRKKLGKPKKVPAAGVLVCLRQHELVYAKIVTIDGKDTIVRYTDTTAHDTVVEYAFTDAKGEVSFKIHDSLNYSVLPVKAGCNYGSPKGTLKNKKFVFVEGSDKIRLFDTYTYKRIKDNGALTVRTPETYRNYLIISFLLFVGLWWLLFGFVVARDRNTKRHSDTLILALLMTLTGLGLLSKFALVNPVTDKLLGWDTLVGTLIGIVAMILIARFDLVKFYNNGVRFLGMALDFDFVMQFVRWTNLPFGKKLEGFDNDIQRRTNNSSVQLFCKLLFLCVLLFLLPVILIVKLITFICSKIPKIKDLTIPNGFGYMLLAISLLVLLFLFGSGPEGSNAKVNLGPFQVSEIAKFLTMFFVAAFFAENSDTLQAFADKQSIFGMRQVKLVLFILAFMVVMMGVSVMLSDMGPAIVVILSFILIYSVARRDTVQMFIGVATFIAMLVLAYWLNHSIVLMAAAALAWLVLWVVISWVRSKRIYESAVFFNLIIVAFLFGGPLLDTLGFHNEAERLTSRNDMVWSGVWNNDVKGGDQVAQGYWALASGGIGGQGLGNGHASVVPACHTDMIFSSIGEDMGWVTLVLIVLCMALLVHRGLLIARKAGNRFAFFLAAGLATVTGIQFLVIILGSLGLIPLTGVAVPFLSYGKSSIVVNMVAYGVILSLSREKATERQAEYIREKYDGIIAAGSASFIAVGLFIVCWLFAYQFFARDNTLIRPAFVTNNQGARVAEYNPRIDILMRKLAAGNIYDRNGVVLATSVDSILNDKKVVDKIVEAGITAEDVKKAHRYPKMRYYPFGDQMFFMLGDFNTKILWGSHDDNPYGYMAESRHLAMLRGFDNIARDEYGKPQKDVLRARNYIYSPYLADRGEKEFRYTRYDYSALLPMLKAGDDSRKVREWNERRPERDISLTIDAKLQVRMQEALQQFAATRKNNYMRVSVVVLDAAQGDLLCSANYPLPNQDTIVAKSNIPYYSDNSLNFKAYTDRDLGMTFQSQPGSTAKVMSAMAGFMKVGGDATGKSYMVYSEEKIDTKLGEPTGNVSLHSAIVQSSNCYFVNSVNDMDLYKQLGIIYMATGVRIDREAIDKRGRTVIDKSLTPYFFYTSDMTDTAVFNAEVSATSSRGKHIYQKYIERRTKKQQYEKMNWSPCAWAWGQGTLRATPLNIARVASIVVNNGTMPQTRYLLNDSLPMTKVCANSLEQLKSYMKDQARMKGGISNSAIGGKTGTPERSHVVRNSKGRRVKSSKNDAWYIFFVDSDGVNQKKARKLAVAVRIERANATSGLAMQLSRNQVIPVLTENGYMK